MAPKVWKLLAGHSFLYMETFLVVRSPLTFLCTFSFFLSFHQMLAFIQYIYTYGFCRA